MAQDATDPASAFARKYVGRLAVVAVINECERTTRPKNFEAGLAMHRSLDPESIGVLSAEESLRTPPPALAAPLWTVDDVATWLKLPRATVYELTRRGDLPVVRLGRHLRYVPEQVARRVGRPGR
jgi:excisionase family DNA binding protein